MHNFYDTNSNGQVQTVSGSVALADYVPDTNGISFGATADLETYVQSVIASNGWSITPDSIFVVLGGSEVDYTQSKLTLCKDMCGFHGPSAANPDFRWVIYDSEARPLEGVTLHARLTWGASGLERSSNHLMCILSFFI